jgi:hypothetical protein
VSAVGIAHPKCSGCDHFLATGEPNPCWDCAERAALNRERTCMDCGGGLDRGEGNPCADCHVARPSAAHKRYCPNCRVEYSLEYEDDGNTVARGMDVTCPDCNEPVQTLAQMRAEYVAQHPEVA